MGIDLRDGEVDIPFAGAGDVDQRIVSIHGLDEVLLSDDVIEDLVAFGTEVEGLGSGKDPGAERSDDLYHLLAVHFMLGALNADVVQCVGESFAVVAHVFEPKDGIFAQDGIWPVKAIS